MKTLKILILLIMLIGFTHCKKDPELPYCWECSTVYDWVPGQTFKSEGIPSYPGPGTVTIYNKTESEIRQYEKENSTNIYGMYYYMVDYNKSPYYKYVKDSALLNRVTVCTKK